MSSDRAINSDQASAPGQAVRGAALLDPRAGEYAQILRECLPRELQPLIAYFANSGRLQVLAAMLAVHFTEVAGMVLNVGCGPFATEFFVLPLRAHRIISFDYTRGFVPAYAALTRRGHIGKVDFLIGDATKLEFAPASFDLVLMHDVLYEPAMDFDHMVVKYDRYLRPGGLLYLTVLGRGTQWIWKLLSQEKPHVRYSLAAVRTRLEQEGFEVLDCQPASLHSPSLLKRAFQRFLWHAFGLANQYAFIARKSPGVQP